METEGISFIAAIVVFALAGCSLVACVVIFFKMHVMDAIRFLRHKTVLPRTKSSEGAKKVAPQNGKLKKSKRDFLPNTKPQNEVVSPACAGVYDGKKRSQSNGKTSPILDTEMPTDVLNEYSSEADTCVLQIEKVPDSENPTGVLPDSENPTGVLPDASIAQLDESENPTGVLPDTLNVKNKTTVIEHRGGVTQQEAPVFRFTLIHNEVVVHTDEIIG